ncbi:MAG: dehydratase [Mycobacteriaceae bacterium]|nr:dehydratase [Mycobacteriaceae bacterium]NBQ42900.1 dehydratase [Mycobacteriaceae bacterium]
MGLVSLARAAVGGLPFIPRGDRLPDRVVRVTRPIDRAHVAAYAAVTGLRYADAVPLTYPFVLTFPTVMSLLASFDFPFPAMGAVHTDNRITALRPITVTDTVSFTTRAANLREHRRGMLADVITEISVGNEPAWQQVSTYLHQQRTSLSDEPKPPPAKGPRIGAPNAVLRITPAQIRRYATISGDSNPIHTSGLGARLFGFPTTIAHGMFSAAAVLANVEGQLPEQVEYSVRFAKPVLLPATAGLYIDRVADGWDLTLRNVAKGFPHLTAAVRVAG